MKRQFAAEASGCQCPVAKIWVWVGADCGVTVVSSQHQIEPLWWISCLYIWNLKYWRGINWNLYAGIFRVSDKRMRPARHRQRHLELKGGWESTHGCRSREHMENQDDWKQGRRQQQGRCLLSHGDKMSRDDDYNQPVTHWTFHLNRRNHFIRFRLEAQSQIPS